MKSGTYQVELGNSLDNVLNSSGGQDKLSEYYQSAIEAYTYDNPDVFYLSPNKLYSFDAVLYRDVPSHVPPTSC